MKYPLRLIILPLLALTLVLSACANNTIALTEQDGLYINEKVGVSYAIAPAYYEPQSVGEPYAMMKLGSIEVTFYHVGDLDPTKWLTEEYSGSATMLVSSDITLPDLNGFAPDTIHLCVQSETVWEFATVTDQAEIDEVVRVYTEGESVSHPGMNPDMTLRFKFSSSAYPDIYYNLICLDYGDSRYLYDRETKRCVEIGDLLSKYIDGKSVTTAAPDTTAEPNA
ncbi:MAG: hypothetical protein IJF49_08740 [Clostridia bacterium]|nr:hypothetical protein [Clostridia bacterium]